MGSAASDDAELAYQAYRVMGRQLKKAGVSWIHSPVVDVNINPENPEIGIMKEVNVRPVHIVIFSRHGKIVYD